MANSIMLLEREAKMNKKVNVDLILQFKKANKLTIEEFCKQCNICVRTYYKIIKGKSANLQSLFGIARAMNVQLTELFN